MTLVLGKDPLDPHLLASPALEKAKFIPPSDSPQERSPLWLFCRSNIWANPLPLFSLMDGSFFPARRNFVSRCGEKMAIMLRVAY